jgi:apolipoprotein N-acyltransferase
VAKSKPARLDLIVWPETMFRDTVVTFDEHPKVPEEYDGTQQQFLRDLRKYSQDVGRSIEWLAQTLDAPLLLGTDRHHYGSEAVQRFNSAVFVGRHGKLLGHYDKIHLVMFGEYVPFVRHFPWLQRLTPVAISLSPGTRSAVFELGSGLRIAPNICYETVIPHVIRRQVNSLKAAGTEPDVLVNLTNDGWFRGSSELDLHLACGVFRAVECRKPLLIAANTGFSAFIDGDGRIRAQGPRRATGTILADVAADPRRSWYLTYGDWPAGICLAGCVVLGLAAAWSRIRRRAAEERA